jgi:hypothetical protein
MQPASTCAGPSRGRCTLHRFHHNFHHNHNPVPSHAPSLAQSPAGPRPERRAAAPLAPPPGPTAAARWCPTPPLTTHGHGSPPASAAWPRQQRSRGGGGGGRQQLKVSRTFNGKQKLVVHATAMGREVRCCMRQTQQHKPNATSKAPARMPPTSWAAARCPCP